MKPKGGAWPDHATGTLQPSPAAISVTGSLPKGVLQEFLRQVFHLPEAELLSLVDVRRPRQRERQQRGGAGPARPELYVAGLTYPPVVHLERSFRPAVAGYVPHDVVVGEHPRGGSGKSRVRGEGAINHSP